MPYLLELKNVDYSYIKGRKVLNSLDLFLGEGEQICLYALSGEGKSTIIKLLTDKKVKNVEIELSGEKLYSLKNKDRGFAVVYDRPLLPPCGTVKSAAEIALKKRKQDVSDADEALKNAGIFHLKDKKLSALSEDEKCLAELARVISVKRRLILLDEPCYKAKNRLEIVKKYLNAAKSSKTAAIFFTSSVELVKVLDVKTLVLFGGKIIFEGDYRDSVYFS